MQILFFIALFIYFAATVLQFVGVAMKKASLRDAYRFSCFFRKAISFGSTEA